MLLDYGDVVCTRYRDGTVVIDHADPAIGVSSALLETGDLTVEDGLLVLDTAGAYRYRPVRFADHGRVVVCERVQDS